VIANKWEREEARNKINRRRDDMAGGRNDENTNMMNYFDNRSTNKDLSTFSNCERYFDNYHEKHQD
jgi:hypothetical protein